MHEHVNDRLGIERAELGGELLTEVFLEAVA
jgi:hypothetical protein